MILKKVKILYYNAFIILVKKEQINIKNRRLS